MSTAAVWNIEQDTGSSFLRVVTVYTVNPDGSQGDPLDVTGATAVWTLQQENTTALTLSSPSSGIALGNTAGTITLSFNATTNVFLGLYEHSLKLTLASGTVYFPVKGLANFKGNE